MIQFYYVNFVQESTLYTAAQEITYLDKVLQESLRVYPPIVE